MQPHRQGESGSIFGRNPFKLSCSITMLLCCTTDTNTIITLTTKAVSSSLSFPLVSSNQPGSLFITIKVSPVRLSHRGRILLIARTWLTCVCVCEMCVDVRFTFKLTFQLCLMLQLFPPDPNLQANLTNSRLKHRICVCVNSHLVKVCVQPLKI